MLPLRRPSHFFWEKPFGCFCLIATSIELGSFLSWHLFVCVNTPLSSSCCDCHLFLCHCDISAVYGQLRATGVHIHHNIGQTYSEYIRNRGWCSWVEMGECSISHLPQYQISPAHPPPLSFIRQLSSVIRTTGLGFVLLLSTLVCCQPTELIWVFLFQIFQFYSPPPP